jgi:excisionase family DNA binding protein
MQSPTPLCHDCNYFYGINSRTCDAFPEGIPNEIWIGKIKHDKPYPFDQGIQFKPNASSEFLSVIKVANLFSVNPKTIYRAIWYEKLPAYKIGRAWRIARKDLERFRKK